jgi:hypothetical protein
MSVNSEDPRISLVHLSDDERENSLQRLLDSDEKIISLNSSNKKERLGAVSGLDDVELTSKNFERVEVQLESLKRALMSNYDDVRTTAAEKIPTIRFSDVLPKVQEMWCGLVKVALQDSLEEVREAVARKLPEFFRGDDQVLITLKKDLWIMAINDDSELVRRVVANNLSPVGEDLPEEALKAQKEILVAAANNSAQ